MTSKAVTSLYICSSCGYETLGWAGKCPQCGGWGTLVQAQIPSEKSRNNASSANKAVPASLTSMSGSLAKSMKKERTSLGIGEFDRVLGGGIVPGEVILFTGEPGIGKSTLLLQIALKFETPVVYVSGEESLSQLYGRVERLSRLADVPKREKSGAEESSGKKTVVTPHSKFQVTDEQDIDRVIAAIYDTKPSFVVVDSIQAVYTRDLPGFPGSISQVRECGVRLTQCAKKLDIPMIIVGQVTKEGAIAGPKVLEHVVDVVLSFEGDDSGQYRMVRCLKNRFGSTDEVGVFEMMERGLVEVLDPSNVFTTHKEDVPGTALSAVYRGSRVLFVEIQALTSPAMFGAARRVGNGINKQRVEMLCAVLTRRGGIDLSSDDVYVSVLGGLRIDDPGVDAAVCSAIASAKRDKPVKPGFVWCGEVGLTGGVRRPALWERIQKAIKNAGLLTTDFSVADGLGVRDLVGVVNKR